MTIKKPICFIAMAFGKTDTEDLYQTRILPVLLKNSILPIIINRRQSNEDLNMQIIAQLERCDFCIVDLTYARPSVYFEAGYAQRAVEVIYTCRKDHFNINQPENERIHFDLQMKPIISWENSNDNQFSKNLEKRIKVTFLNDWVQKDQEREKNEEAIKVFSNQTLTQRLILLRIKSIEQLTKIGFSGWNKHKIDQFRLAEINYQTKDIISGKINHVYGRKENNRCFEIVTIQSFQSITQEILREFSNSLYTEMILYHEINQEKAKNIDRVIRFNLLLSLSSISSDKIEKSFSYFKIIEKGKIYLHNTIIELGHPVFSNEYLLILPRISSEISLQESLNDLIDKIYFFEKSDQQEINFASQQIKAKQIK